jgi:hypothetical protein
MADTADTTTTAAVKAPKAKRAAPRQMTCELIVQNSVQAHFKQSTAKRSVKSKDPLTGEPVTTEEEVTPNCSGDVFQPLDKAAIRLLTDYGLELANWNYAPSNDCFLTLRRAKAEELLANMKLTQAERYRAIYNVCLFLSACIENAIENLHGSVTVFSRNIQPQVDLLEAVMLAPLKDGERTAAMEADCYKFVAPAPRKRGSAGGGDDDNDDDDDGEAAEVAAPAPKKKRAPAAAPRKKKAAAAAPVASAEAAPAPKVSRAYDDEMGNEDGYSEPDEDDFTATQRA